MPPGFKTDDPVPQSEAYKAVTRVDTLTDPKFKDAPCRPVFVSQLRNIYNLDDPNQSLGLLKSRHTAILDSEFVTFADDPSLGWDFTEGALDFCLFVPRFPGLRAIIPNTDNDPTYEWKLELRRHTKQFNSKHAKLGFDPCRAMLFAGNYRNEEVFWIFPPTQFFENPDFDAPPAGYSSGDTTVAFSIYLQALIIIAYVFSKENIHGVTLTNPYPAQLTRLEDVKAVTNLLYVLSFPLLSFNIYHYISFNPFHSSS